MTEKTGNYRFSNEWFAKTATHWPELFKAVKWDPTLPKVIIEIGSFEGASAVWMLENLMRHRESRLYCLDTFAGGIEHSSKEVEGLEQRFNHNIGVSGKGAQVEVLKGRSVEGLVKLLTRGTMADFIYIDGSHMAADVMADAVLSWELLRPGGLMVFDDYLWPVFQDQPLKNPKFAIDAFVNCHLDQIRFIASRQRSQFCLLKKYASARPNSGDNAATST
jgi:predicted O-methyltransferase YrrM